MNMKKKTARCIVLTVLSWCKHDCAVVHTETHTGNLFKRSDKSPSCKNVSVYYREKCAISFITNIWVPK